MTGIVKEQAQRRADNVARQRLQPGLRAAQAQTEWPQAREDLRDAPVYWLSTVRPDGRPHVTPLIGIWLDGALYFCTGPTERKAKNLAQNPHCILTTGRNQLDGLDLVVEGEAATVNDEPELRTVAETFESKYGRHFTAPEGTWFGLGDAIRGGNALVYRVTPTTAFGFGKGKQFSQTRWRFDHRGGRPTTADQSLLYMAWRHVSADGHDRRGTFGNGTPENVTNVSDASTGADVLRAVRGDSGVGALPVM
jgi:nitroimidazol reductase NimA-like FMN-containing flavoprotein (pyridoxamine 5'-phosphate oxidase superfamily)